MGERLARWALADTYGKPVVQSGPIFNPTELVQKDDEAIIHFDYAKQLKTRDGGPLQGFTVAAKDEVFVHADAKIADVSGRPAVVVTVPAGSLAGPIAAVRYAWADNPAEANLVNEEGLPASPFRTDMFDGPKDGKKRKAASATEPK